MRRRPGVTLAMMAILTLALTAAAVAFGVARGVLWRPLLFPEASRLVFVWERVSNDGAPEPARVTGRRFIDWRARTSSFSSMAAFGAASLQVEGPDGINNIRGVRVSSGFLDTLGVTPALGRGFTAADQAPGAPRVVVLSHAYWRQRMGGRADVLGQTLRMSGASYTIVGVMPDIWMPAWPVNPAAVTLDPESRQLWVPMAPDSALAENGRSHVMGVVGRLKDGRTLAMAEQELDQSGKPDDLDRHGAMVRPFRGQVTGLARGPLVTLIGAALCVWLVACLNLAALQLATFERRREEFATRFALGAAPGRLAAQLWIESALLVAGASLAAVAATAGVFFALPARLSAHVPFVALPTVDVNVVVMVIGLACMTVAVLTLWPMRRVHGLKGLEQQRVSTVNPKVFRTLVVAQLAGTVALVVVSALLLRSFWALQARDPGFDVSNVVAMDLGLPAARFAKAEPVTVFETALRDRLSAAPWADGAALAYDHPLEANWLDNVTIIGGPQGSDADAAAQSQLRIVSPTYFRTLGVRVVEGRAFEEHEGLASAGVVMVNEAFMRRTPLTLGRRLRVSAPRVNWGDAAPEEFAIVGVVEDERFRGLEANVEPAVYVSTRQFPLSDFVLLVRASGTRADVGDVLRTLVRQVEPAVSLTTATTMEGVQADQQLTRTLTTDLVGGFAGLSLLLASVGLHGLLTLIVTGRRREIGIRLALGASRGTVAGLVIRESVRPMLIGVLMGLLLAQLASDSVRALLVDITASDPWSLAGVTVFMLVVGVAAAAIPARHATRVDPARTLRG
jgi:putative ABC transport system permease protein